MKIKHTLIFLALTTLSYGQETANFDRSFHYRTDDSKSENKREYIVTDSLIEIKDYNKNGLFRTGKFYGFNDLKNLDEFIWFNSNRQYDKSPNLIIKDRKGTVKYFNKEGESTSKQLFIEDKTKHIQLWNNNKPYLTNGTGKYQCNSDKKNEKLVRIFKDSIEIDGYIIRELKKDTIYYKTDTKAYPKNGLKPFYRELAKNIQYPGFAKLLGIDKRITVEFVVDENGKLTDFEPLNNRSLSFEKKAIKKLEKMPKWIPATLNGKNVKTRFRIPLTFKH
ncbi:energy transducer TonB [Flaviramulus sp. BrNp1-15]|uniref:energy transducer TonB n=1 Tax=Flaviramulus sp. BrNp1-15 TaxID=2916754 RepID=UPI001EE8194C|nr:energy transducer TonB [Flaviramulus sp. BrNp1-15]ULC58798.1 energy transducer TonB [Flaviramulus sp. BrNp1-15]